MSKYIKLVVAIPSGGDTWKAKFALCLIDLMRHCMSTPTSDGHGIISTVFNQTGSILSRNREMLIESALKFEADYMLFLDDDMTFPKDLFHRLQARQKPVVAANCPTKMIPSQWTARRKSEVHDFGEIVFTDPHMTGVEQVWRVGTGVMLIRGFVLRRVKAPLFEVKWNESAGRYVGEDWYFCEKLERAQVPVFVDHGVSNEIGHIGTMTYNRDLIGDVVQVAVGDDDGRNTESSAA